MIGRGLKQRVLELTPAALEFLVNELVDPARTHNAAEHLETQGWSKLEIIELHAAAIRGTLDQLAIGGAPRASNPGPIDWEREPDPPTLDEYVNRYVRDTLADCGGNKSEAAERLGISRRTLYRMLEKAGLHTSTPRAKPAPVTLCPPAGYSFDEERG